MDIDIPNTEQVADWRRTAVSGLVRRGLEARVDEELLRLIGEAQVSTDPAVRARAARLMAFIGIHESLHMGRILGARWSDPGPQETNDDE